MSEMRRVLIQLPIETSRRVLHVVGGTLIGVGLGFLLASVLL